MLIWPDGIRIAHLDLLASSCCPDTIWNNPVRRKISASYAPTQENLYDILKLHQNVETVTGDVRDYEMLAHGACLLLHNPSR